MYFRRESIDLCSLSIPLGRKNIFSTPVKKCRKILTRYIRLNGHVTLHLVSMCLIWKIVGIYIIKPTSQNIHEKNFYELLNKLLWLTFLQSHALTPLSRRCILRVSISHFPLCRLFIICRQIIIVRL